MFTQWKLYTKTYVWCFISLFLCVAHNAYNLDEPLEFSSTLHSHIDWWCAPYAFADKPLFGWKWYKKTEEKRKTFGHHGKMGCVRPNLEIMHSFQMVHMKLGEKKGKRRINYQCHVNIIPAHFKANEHKVNRFKFEYSRFWNSTVL